MRIRMVPIVVISVGCTKHDGFGSKFYGECGEISEVVASEDSPFDEAPDVTADAVGDFVAEITRDNTENPAPTRWHHHLTVSSAKLTSSDPAVSCDQPKILLEGLSQVEADGLFFASRTFVTWMTTEDEAPHRDVLTLALDASFEELAAWVVSEAEAAGVPVLPPYETTLWIQEGRASLVLWYAPTEGNTIQTATDAEVPSLGGSVSYPE